MKLLMPLELIKEVQGAQMSQTRMEQAARFCSLTCCPTPDCRGCPLAAKLAPVASVGRTHVLLHVQPVKNVVLSE